MSTIDKDRLAGLAKAELARRELSRRYLFYFFQNAWQVLEPGTELHVNWHHELICEHLQLVTRGETKNLLINVMPRSLKSRIVSVFWPCWEWLQIPSMDFLCMSYASSLANDLNDDRRTLINSGWYQALSGGMLLSNTKNRISEFRNDKRGQMLARGLDGAVTGVGGRRLIFDDPNDPENIESQVTRESTLKKFKGLSSTRKNDPKNTAIVIVQQRTHEEDVSGYVLKNHTEYLHVNMPTEAEATETLHFPLSGKSVSRKPGDLLDPSRFGWDEVKMAKKTLSSYQYAGRHQQRPVPLGGGMIKLEWFNRFTTPPANPLRIVQSWDCAASAKELASYWVCGTFAEYQGQYFLIDVYRKQMTYPEGKRMAVSLAQRFNPSAILIENKSTGQALIPELRENPDFIWSIISIEPEKDKITRMSVETPAIEAGRMFLPAAAPWLPDVETELSLFPLGATADIVDVLSQFLRWAREGSSVSWISLYGR
jgi:predicted phage terminase large subunit-like protein